MLFIFGVLVGTPIGIFIMALVVAASTADALESELRNRRKYKNFIGIKGWSMEPDGILGLVEQYGLPLILLLGAIYALYRFLVFSLYEVKNEFGRRNESAAESMAELKVSVGEMRADIKILVEFVKTNR